MNKKFYFSKNYSIILLISTTFSATAAEQSSPHSLGVIDVLEHSESKNDAEDKNNVEDTYYSPMSSTYLGKTQVERFRGTRNSSIFNNITGVQVHNPANEAGAVDIGIRGMQGNGRVPVVIDDAVQSTMTERGYQGSADRTYIDMDLIRSVKVDKGPAISADTAGATGGRVEMRTINADDVIPKGDRFGINFNAGIYNNNRTPDTSGNEREQGRYILKNNQKSTDFRNGFYTFAVAGRNEHGSLLVAYTERNTGNYFAGKRNSTRYNFGSNFDDYTRPGQEVPNTSNENRSFLAKMSADLNEDNKLLITYRHHNQKAGEILAAYLNKHKDDKGNDVQSQWSLGTAKLDSVSISHRFNPLDNHYVDMKSVLFYTEVKTEQHNGFMGNGMYGDQYWNSVRDRRLGINVTNTTLFPALPIMGDTNLNYGIAFEKQLIDPRVTQRSRGSTNLDGNRTSNSVFLNLTSEPFSWVTASVGVRKSTVELHSNRQAEHTRNVFDNPENGGGGWATYLPKGLPMYCPNKVGGKYFSPDINNPDEIRKNCLYSIQNIVTGHSKKDFRYALRPDFTGSLTLHITPDLDVFTSYANVSRAPSAYEQISQGGTFNSAAYQGQSIVDAENTENVEFGISARHEGLISSDDQINVKISRFYNKNKNYIAPAATPDGLYAFVNYDSYSTRGIELQADYDTGKFYTSAGYTYFDKQTVCSRLLSGQDNRCNSVGFAWGGISSRMQPKENFVLTTGYRFFNDNSLDIGARYHYHSGKNNPENWYAGTAAQGILDKADKNQLIDIYASYKLNKNITLKAGVDNVTNQYAIAPGSVVWIPEPGRTVHFTVNTQF